MNRLWIPFGLSVALLASTGCTYSTRDISTRPDGSSTVMVRNDYYPHLQTTSRLETHQSAQGSATSGNIGPYAQHRECTTKVHNDTWVLIHGQEVGSKVNIRPGPGFNYYDGHYTLVGDSAKVIGRRGNWYKARFAETLHEGWLHCSVIDNPDV